MGPEPASERKERVLLFFAFLSSSAWMVSGVRCPLGADHPITYGLKKPELVLDNGFFSRDNVRAFVTHHVGFTMRATLSDNWIYRLIDEETSGGRLAREKLTNPSSTCPFDPNIHAASFTQATDLGPAKVSDPNGEQLSIRLHYHYYKNRAKAALEEGVIGFNG